MNQRSQTQETEHKSQKHFDNELAYFKKNLMKYGRIQFLITPHSFSDNLIYIKINQNLLEGIIFFCLDNLKKFNGSNKIEKQMISTRVLLDLIRSWSLTMKHYKQSLLNLIDYLKRILQHIYLRETFYIRKLSINLNVKLSSKNKFAKKPKYFYM
ncbi:unnamed protein product [Paramecium pentaurelia]|uniref:Uncharacterized protein n=1 Tax=Paramecium pentaurelia TaxID=43138 RepID=A0A8S1TZU6_9CILI|nr:unnamed protein product [Paramecium pentaurelia]